MTDFLLYLRSTYSAECSLDGDMPATPTEAWAAAKVTVHTGTVTLAQIVAAAEASNAGTLPAPVPVAVTPRQARLALLSAGLLDAVEASIAAGPRADQITWEFAVDVRRDYPMIENMRTALGLTSAQVDALFRTAATL